MLGEAGSIVPWSLGRDRGPADTLALGSQPLEPREKRSLWLEVCSRLLWQFPDPGPYGRLPAGSSSQAMPPAPSGPTPPVAPDTRVCVTSGHTQRNRASQTTGLWGPHPP